MVDKLPYFKVVQTIEDGQLRLIAVPRFLEDNGKLFWPPKSKQKKILKNAISIPSSAADGWQTFDCILKRSFIPSYEAALDEVHQMSDLSETASDADIHAKLKNKERPRLKIIKPELNADANRCNFNWMVNDEPPTRTIEANQQHQLQQEEIEQRQQQYDPNEQMQQQQQQPQHDPNEQMQQQQQQQHDPNEQQHHQLHSEDYINNNPSLYSYLVDGDVLHLMPQNPIPQAVEVLENNEEISPETEIGLTGMVRTLLDYNAKLNAKLDHSIKLQEKILKRLDNFSQFQPTNSRND